MSEASDREPRPPEAEPGADDDRGTARREAEAAEAEAARIGGRVEPDSEDPAMRPVDEGGEGEAEGFELAEKELAESAGHGDSRGFPDEDLRDPEEREDAARGEPDEAIPPDQ